MNKRRLDASENEALIGIARMGADAFGYTADLRIDRQLAAAFQDVHDALAEHFSREEILEIVGIVVNMNVWTRIKLAEGAMPGPA